ncbi:phosphopantetheine-binding protein [Streptomyces sp. NPDC059255]|uniref:phosphopantetheine-binding protein n=1 Tax=Streptomyces sp. NPDC059255 TaxID=3346793 RepID=UPI0036AEC88F
MMSLTSENSFELPLRSQIFDDIRKVLVGQCETPPERAETLTEKDSMSSLELDSITLAYVFTYFEQRHDLTFENDDIDPMRYTTVGELLDTLVDRVAGPDAR